MAIDDDLLSAAKAIARQEQRTVGEVMSDLARRALRLPEPAATRNGIPLLARRDSQLWPRWNW